ncbi:MAG: HAD-IIA family hydrolase [Bifidobacteriaceae bacterium]|nr:HAD-IIA family hydrolase [Bifidobacteriaceae bacterium]
MNAPIEPHALKSTDKPLSEIYDLALLDLDGVVYRGKNPVEHAAEGIGDAESHGMQISYTTNNPSRYPRTVAEQLEGFGLTVADNQVITSAIVAARMLAQMLPPRSKVLVVGREHLCEEIAKNGLVPVHTAAENPDAVIQSWHQDLSWAELAEASYAIHNGARYFVTNKDLTIPREGGIAPGNGAMQIPVTVATGKKPEASAGKPEAAMYDESRMLFSQTADLVPVEKSLPCGDRLDTDIEAANRGGYDSLVVLTGVATPASIITAEPIHRPTYVTADLRGLNLPQPAVTRNADGSYSCNAATARICGNELSITIDGVPSEHPDTLDGLRAACDCVWQAMDDQGLDAGTLRIPEFPQALRGCGD